MNKQMITDKMKGVFESVSGIVKFRHISEALRRAYSFLPHVKGIIDYGVETKKL